MDIFLSPRLAAIGDTIKEDGKSYIVMSEFTQGKEAKQSGMTIFMWSGNKLLGLVNGN